MVLLAPAIRVGVPRPLHEASQESSGSISLAYRVGTLGGQGITGEVLGWERCPNDTEWDTAI